MGLLDNRIALVTGAGRGIGLEIARLYAEEGASVAIHYYSSAAAATELANSLPNNAIAIGADLSNPHEAQVLVQRVRSEYGRLDILVNNAAGFHHARSFADEDWEDYEREWNEVFGATFHTCKAAAPVMKSGGGGKIINFLATLLQRPAKGMGAHTVAKAAVMGLTRVLARELGPDGITVNAISPGMTLTDYTLSLKPEDREKIARLTPLRRVAVPNDVARVALFYASELADFVTGAIIAPDGGLAVL
jgi:3-oxoacyl-[acyl-carrier protein] reductase